MESQLCSGYGMHHTNEKDAKKPHKKLTPYATIDLQGIRDLVDNPQQVDKTQAQWLIPSTLLSRKHKSQKDNGTFWALWFDHDKDLKTLAVVSRAVADLVEGSDYEVYTSRSATEDCQKSRVIIPLKAALNGADWKSCQEVLNDLMEASGVTPDPANTGTGQVCYLPNKGEHYESISQRTGELFDPLVAFKEDLKAKRLVLVIEQKKAQEKAAKRKANIQDKKGGLIQVFNDAFAIEEILILAGYEQCGDTFMHPESESGSYSASVKDGRVHTLSSSDPLFTGGEGGGAHDAFSAFQVLFHEGNRDEALMDAGTQWLTIGGESWNAVNQRKFMQAKALELPAVGGDSSDIDVGHNLASRIEGIIKGRKLENFDLSALNVNPSTIAQIVARSFWDSKRSRYYSLTDKNVLNAYSAKDGLKFLVMTSGSIFNTNYVYEWAESQGAAWKDAQTKALIKSLGEVVTDYLILESQRTNIEMRVDMFADTPRIEMRDELARIVYTHKPFIQGLWDVEIVADYKDHFPLLDDFLDFIIASRFARDRKKSYLWIKADSDWGKGFLMGVLGQLNMSVELSVKEVEKMFEGAPVGKSMQDFKSAFVIVIDEFKTVKSEIKQLQSEISLAPKNQLSFKVEVFAKLFFSAESVNSLVGEHGVEEQFINRFNHFDLKGTLDSRPLYKKVGSGAYIDSITPYVANYLNKGIEEKRAAGKAKAEHNAEQYLVKFMNAHGIGNTYDSLTDGLGVFVRELAAHIKDDFSDSRIKQMGDYYYLLKPAKYIDDYIKDTISFSGVATLTRKRSEIMNLLSENGDGAKPHRLNKYEGTIRAIKIDLAHTDDDI